MKRIIHRSSSGFVHTILGTVESRRHFEEVKSSMFVRFLFLAPLALLSPLGFLIGIIFFVNYYHRTIKKVFFSNKGVTATYKNLLRMQGSEKMFSVVGYRVYPSELEEHLQLINSENPDDLNRLKKKGKLMRASLHRQFGFDVDRMTRHFVFLGTTGAGKTESLMSFFTDVIKNGGGIGMVDGKGDQEMEFKIYNLCRENYYETQFYAIILNAPEKGTPSNTYSPLLGYTSALKATEFLGEFIDDSGGGNSKHFTARAKVMQGNIVTHYKNQQRYYHKAFTLADIAAAQSMKEMNNIFFMAYGIALDIEEVIRAKTEENISFYRIMEKAKGVKSPMNLRIEMTELLIAYANQNPHTIRSIERALLMDFAFIRDYFTLYSQLYEYMRIIKESWADNAIIVASGIYTYFKHQEKRSYLYNSSAPIDMKDIRICYTEIKSDDNSDILRYIGKESSKSRDKLVTLSELKIALGHGKDISEHIEHIPATSIQQHQYAQQHWDRIFRLFMEYERIMGTPHPDVDGEDIVRNNKVLYTMLPVLDLSKDQIEFLGKMFILMYKSVASSALGGEKQTATPVQFKIFVNKIKPRPIFLIVFDEIGSFIPADSLSFLASQIRSLAMSMILSGQDNVSVMPDGGNGKREQSRIFANMAKLLLKSRDVDLADFEKIIPKVEIIEGEGFIKSAISDKIISTNSFTVKSVPLVDVSIATRFAKGMGAYIDDNSGEPTYFQSYYLGDNSKYAIRIRRFMSFKEMIS